MNGIFLQWLGFMLLITPFALLCYVPFEKSAFRPEKRVAWVAMAAVLAVLAAGFSLLHYIFPDGQNIQLPGTLYMAVSVLAGIAVYCLTVQEAMVKKIIALCVSVEGGITEYHLASLLLYHTLPFYSKYATDSYMFTLPGVICYFLLDLLIIPLLFLFFCKILRKYFKKTQSEEINRHLPFFATMTFLYLTMAFAIGVNDRYENAVKILSIRLFLFIFSIFCVFEAYRFLFWEIEQNRERNEFRHLLEIQRLQFEKLTSDIENTKRIRHDMKYLLRTLGALVGDGQTDKALELIRQESDQFALVEQHNHCNEPCLNGLLQHYTAKMQDAGIRFQTNIRIETPPIPVSELLILVGNLLENALEAGKACDGQAFVKCNAGIVNSMLVIYMENSCREVFYENRTTAESRQEAGQWLSAKDFCTEKIGGGMGLRSIEQIVRNHAGGVGGGGAEYRVEKGKFISRVILQIEK
ncbi:MAG: GHKL domain-containing protein [Eubacterium sp.]|nr:GHKL domain-containing protein [Eubacterium sp.]